MLMRQKYKQLFQKNLSNMLIESIKEKQKQTLTLILPY